MEYDGSFNGPKEPPAFALRHDPWGQLLLIDAEGEQHNGVEVVRAFPLSDPRRGIAVCDAHGRELLWIDNLDDLPASLIEQIENELARREFVPIIRRVLHVSAPVEPSEWQIETDRGRTTFVLDSEDDVCEMEGKRALVTDANGVRYLILDIDRLDAHSRQLLERYL